MKQKPKLQVKDVIVFTLLLANLALTGYFVYRFVDFKENHYDHIEALNTRRFYNLERATGTPSPTLEEIQRKGYKCRPKEINENGTQMYDCR